jgi:hypothetical protein
MRETLSLSIFTIEADRKPLLAFAAKKYQEAEAFCEDHRVPTKLRSVTSGGVQLCDDRSILRVRLANPDESDHPWKIRQRSFWSIWTKDSGGPRGNETAAALRQVQRHVV